MNIDFMAYYFDMSRSQYRYRRCRLLMILHLSTCRRRVDADAIMPSHFHAIGFF